MPLEQQQLDHDKSSRITTFMLLLLKLLSRMLKNGRLVNTDDLLTHYR